MGLRQWLVDDLFREPSGGRLPWISIVAGVVFSAVAIASAFEVRVWGEPFDVSVGYIFNGFAFALLGGGGAELVPAGRRRLSAVLRVSGLVGFVLFGVVVTVPHLLAVPALEQTVAVVFTGFILAFVWVFTRTGTE